MNINVNSNCKVLNSFLNYLINIKEYSEETVKRYNINLLIFFKFLKDYWQIDLEINEFSAFILMQVKTSDIYAFLSYLSYVRDNKPCSRNIKVSNIRVFYDWLILKYFYNSSDKKMNPTKNISYAKKVQRLPKYLNREQAKKLQNIFSNQNSKFPERNNTIITLFLSSGMRVSELAHIKIENINFHNNTINVIGKGNKERVVFYSDYCKEKLLIYLKDRKNNKKMPLFLNQYQSALNKTAIQRICKKAFQLAGLEEYNFTTHSLRHTAATLLYQTTNDILLVKNFLGHESILSTEIYSHLENQILKEAADRNPLNKF